MDWLLSQFLEFLAYPMFEVLLFIKMQTNPNVD